MSALECSTARRDLHDALRERLAPEAQRRLDEHLQGCADCRALEQRERALDAALGRLPEHRAPAGLEGRLLASLGNLTSSPPPAAVLATRSIPDESALPARPPRASSPRTWAAVAATLALAVAALVVALRSGSSSDALVAEAVNDHLRVLYAQQPIEIESGGIHQVKPWFAGRLDFAPRLAFEGDTDFNLAGGSVGYFIDRKAAVFIFKHRLHVITLFEFRADGLPWRGAGELELGTIKARQSQLRGFQVISFRNGDLGYALVSDVDASALEQLAARVASGL